MNDAEANSVLQAELKSYRSFSYAQLVELLDKPQVKEVGAESGATYAVEIQVFWDNRSGGAVRVMGSINDGSWRAFVPLTDDFIVAPDGSFVGE